MARREKKDLVDKVIDTIKKHNLIESGDKLVLGVSGGPDSICMLDILIKIKEKEQNSFDFVVAHVNHMIRIEAKEDEEYVKNFCMQKNIEFYSKSIDVKKIANNNKISTEEAGRNARYTFFDEILKKVKGNKIAIAHNKNDKVETIIMNELRGCGISGLRGIEIIRDKYIRPLIECERKEIEKYCNENNLQPRIDKTNFENIYTRNKIRNIVIPYIQQEFNPNIIETMNRLSEVVSEQEEYIQKQVEIIYRKILIEEELSSNQIEKNMGSKKINAKDEEGDVKKDYIILDLKGFNNQEKVIKSNIIIYTITRLCNTSKGIERIHIEDIIKLCQNNIGNKFLKPNKNLRVFVKDSKIKFSKEV